MKAKKLAKRLRARSAEFHDMAMAYEGERDDGEFVRLITISDTLRLIADEVKPLGTKHDTTPPMTVPSVLFTGKQGS
jgi:hypothetical protein